jgi:heme/copper-type cytochrome/quinol oxidase subunit 4
MSRPTPLPVPKSATDDAKQRAIRSYLGGLVVAVLVAILPLAEAGAGHISWTLAWWAAFGNALLSPALAAGASYVMRHLAPPA